MNAKKFSDAMGELDMRYVDEAIHYPAKKRIRKTWTVLLVAAMVSVCLTAAGIAISHYHPVDKSSSVENEVELSSIALQAETVYLEVDPTIKDVQMTADSVWTNTMQITVSADQIKGDTKISLFLYNADDLDMPILYATLTAKNPSVDFENLTSRFAYKVGATAEGTDEMVVLNITD